MTATLFSICTLLAIAVCRVDASFSFGAKKLSLPLASRFVSVSLSDGEMSVEDAWVDTQITSPTLSMCKSLTECGWNTTSWNQSIIAYADILGSKRLLLTDTGLELAAASSDTAAPPQVLAPDAEVVVPQDEVVIASSANEKLALETSAVRLSLFLAQSCTESGPRQCWQSGARERHMSSSSASSPRKLRPVTITFAESASTTRKAPSSSLEAPLIRSLKHFRLSA
jgi:hypothetical protein